jgi:hypothetical protein
MKKPRTIKILLADGIPSGIRIAEIGGRVAKAIVVPRNKIKEAVGRKELNTVGIYFLIGQKIDSSKPDVYIGEAEQVYKRLLQHNNDEKKDFWNIAICFISANNSINKAHVKYLEGYCYNQAKKINRCNVVNGSIPAETQLPETDVADVMDFFGSIELLISTLGYPLFDDINVVYDSEKIYYCKGPSANAKGKYSDEGLVVYSGSMCRKVPTKTTGAWIQNMIEKLITNGILESEGKDSYRFTQNYIFSSPSAAAAVILARHANGWTAWKDDNGNTLDKNERK